MNRYDSYKESGVEWIGEIPSHWRKSKFKYVSQLFTGNSLNDEQKELYESDNSIDIPYVSSKDIDVNYQTINYNNGLRIPKENNPLKISPKGSFLMVIEGGSSGRKKVFLEEDVCFVNKLCSFNSIENTKFQFYFIQSNNYQSKFKMSLSGLIGGVSISNLKDFEISLPPLSEQQQIVSFLDDKTQKIDSLIQQKEKKIELLKEKRTSLINHVVTKGIDPNVEMKDSGVDWIGEIPNHWEYIPTKYFTINDKGVQTGPFGTQLNTKDYVESGVKVMNQKTLIDEDYDIGEEFISYEKYESLKVFEVIEGDIIMGTRGSFGTGKRTTFGKVSIVPSGLGDCVLHPCLIRIRLRENLMMKRYYYIYVNDSSYFLDDVKDTSNSTTIEVIYGVTLKDIKVPVPPIKEQQQIVEYLDKQTEEIDTLIQLEQKKIELLKEYRQSLISEVVTGKRKVVDDNYPIIKNSLSVTLPYKVLNPKYENRVFKNSSGQTIQTQTGEEYLKPKKELIDFLNKELSNLVKTKRQKVAVVVFFKNEYFRLVHSRLIQNYEFCYWTIYTDNQSNIISRYYYTSGTMESMAPNSEIIIINKAGITQELSSNFYTTELKEEFKIFNR